MIAKQDLPKVYIVIVNYRNWTDTLECLESVLRIDYPNYQVVVVDNSEDEGSIGVLRKWANGNVAPQTTSDRESLRRLTNPPVGKPIRYIIRDDEGLMHSSGMAHEAKPSLEGRSQLVLIHPGKNCGFAGGSNLGLRYACSAGDCDYVLLLNNDTVVEPDFIFPLVETYGSGTDVGLVGGLVKYYSDPDQVWFSSGSFHWYKEGLHSDRIKEGPEIVNSDFVTGCLMMIPRSVISSVGLLSEEFFLYGEDTDYSLMVLRAGYRNLVNHRSVVYHKINRTTGGRFSKVAYYYGTRNRLYYHYKHYPRLDFLVFALIFISSKALRFVQFLVQNDVEARSAMVKGVVDFFKMRRKLSNSDRGRTA